MRPRQGFLGVLVLLVCSSTAAPAVWVALPDSHRVLAVDTASGEVLAEHSFDAAPTRLALTPDGRYLYVACHDDGQTHVIDPAGGGLYKRLPYIVPVFAGTDSVHYYAPGLGGVYRNEVDGYNSKQLAYLPDTQFSYDYALTPDGRWFAYIQRYLPRPGRELAEPPTYRRVAVCDLDNESGTYLELPGEALRVDVSPTGEYGVAATLEGDLVLFTLAAAPTVAAEIELPEPAVELSFGKNGVWLYCLLPGELRVLGVPNLEDEPVVCAPPAETVGENELVAGVLDPGSATYYAADAAGRLWLRRPDSLEFELLSELGEAPAELILQDN
jgi:hypothetical protein